MNQEKDNDVVARYYAKLAPDYDLQEQDEDREEDLEEVADGVAGLIGGQRVLELACGTGHWTGILADEAEHVIAVDINEAMLEQARERGLDEEQVSFVQADALDLPADLELGDVGVVFIGFWWSHLTRDAQERLLAGLRKRVAKAAQLIILDDNYVEGLSLPVARTDAQGNTYQMVTAPDGERFELPKSYPTDSSLRKRFANIAREVRVARWDTVWVLTCRLK